MTQRYELARGRLILREAGTNGFFREIGDIENGEYSFAEDYIDVMAHDETGGQLAHIPKGATGTLTLNLNSTSIENFVLTHRGKGSTQAAVTNGTFKFPVIEKGQYFQLPHGNITAIEAPGLVEGVDYKCFKHSGNVKALKDNLTAIEAGTYSAGLMSKIGIAAAKAKIYEIEVFDDSTGLARGFYKWQPNLPQSVQLINIDDLFRLPVEGVILKDDTRSFDDDMGQFGYVKMSLVNPETEGASE